MAENIQIFIFAGHSGEAVLAPQISERPKFSSGSLSEGSAILIASWPPVVENGSDSGAADPAARLSSQSSFPAHLALVISPLSLFCVFDSSLIWTKLRSN